MSAAVDSGAHLASKCETVCSRLSAWRKLVVRFRPTSMTSGGRLARSGDDPWAIALSQRFGTGLWVQPTGTKCARGESV